MSEIHAIQIMLNNTSGRQMAYRHRLWHTSVMERCARMTRDARARQNNSINRFNFKVTY